MNPTDYTISVREIAEFVHRRGDLGGEGQFQRRNRAIEGIKGHQRIQKSRGPEYRSEVPIEGTFTQSGVQLKVQGRIDGLIDGLIPHLEEIKTVESRWSREANPVHWAQVRLYAGLLTLQNECAQFSLQLTYLELETEEVTIFHQEITREEAISFLHETIAEWFSWLVPHVEWIRQRNHSIETVPFPFNPFRKGQRELSISVYRAIRDRHHLFVEAPTGMGKTLATLFPAIKALPLMEEGKIFYATAKGSGRWTAEEGAERLRKSGLRLRSLSLTAKSKICFSE
ncbi:MAG: ATP-dependent DNA helicase, partial [Verrucomicrobiota bacterium]